MIDANWQLTGCVQVCVPHRLQAQVTRDGAEELELQPGQIVFVRPSRVRVFAN